jgi:hypothetical protein
MDDRTGDLYPSKSAALMAGVPEAHIVEMVGPAEAIRRVARRVRMASRHEHARRQARRAQQKASRKANRR